MENNTENRSIFFNQYHRQNLNSSRGKCCLRDADFIDELEWIELKYLENITEKEAFEVARIIHGESDQFAIEFNAEGLTSISPFGLPCYCDTVDINWDGSLRYEWGTSLKYLKAFDYLRSLGYALPYMNLRIQDLVNYGWIKIKEDAKD